MYPKGYIRLGVSRWVRFSAIFERMGVRRSPWMNGRAGLLVRLLDELHGLSVSEDEAREDVSNHVDYVAEMMRIGRRTAKRYVTDDVIRKMADRIAREVGRRQAKRVLDPRPGSHLRIVPP